MRHSAHNDDAVADLLEIEHLISQAFGGTNHRSNLTVACNRCNKLKDDRLSFVDFYHEQFNVVTDDKTKVMVGPHIALALMMKQDGKCFHCEKFFYAIAPEKIVVTRRERDDYFHFRNCYIACEPCSERLSIDGIAVSVPFPGPPRN